MPDIAHTFLDLLITYVQSSANTSPSTPSSPSPHLPRLPQSHLSQQQHHLSLYQYNADQLFRLKIFMRQTEHNLRSRWGLTGANSSENLGSSGSVIEGLGQNEGTTIFSFFPKFEG